VVEMSKRDDEEVSRKSGLAYAAGITLFASVVVFCAIGWMIDRWRGTSPWFLAAGIVVGAALGLFEFIRISSKTY
jgi:F0F1-type ATP synthase assembly protein I